MTDDRLAAAIAEQAEALGEAVRAEAAAVPPAPDWLLSVDEAAETLWLGRSATYGELQAGRLRSIKIGRRRLVAAGAIANFVAERAS
jgi:excisionase family DNA binding protein